MVIVTVKLTEEEILDIIKMIKNGKLRDDFIKMKEWINEAKEVRIIEMNKVDPKKEYIEKIKGELNARDNKS